jgi:hypothetical protein
MIKRTAVLIHGCHLRANLNGQSWEEIVFGSNDPEYPTLVGRVVMGMLQVVRHRAEFVLFSTGASEKDGMKEAVYTHKETLPRLFAISCLLSFPKDDLDFLRLKIESAIIDDESQNTREECRRNLRLCSQKGIQRVILVSSPWHIERCFAEALEAVRTMGEEGLVIPEILASASYGSTEGVVISEPPHRGDRPKVPIHKAVKRADRLGRNPSVASDFYKAFNEFLLGWEEKIKK